MRRAQLPFASPPGLPLSPLPAPCSLLLPMSKNRPNTPQRDSSGSAARRGNRPSAAVRIVVSVMLVWHVSAVFLAPLSIPPSSGLVRRVAQGPPMQWYLNGLYLNHGYAFFAPDPGDGHLVRYVVLDQNRRPIKEGEFPNRETQWPRLFYHRYFMLAEQTGAGLEDQLDPNRGPRRYLEAFARHLLRQYDGQTAHVHWIAHRPPDPTRVSTPVNLRDPANYTERLEVVQRRSDLTPRPVITPGPRNAGRPAAANPWTGATR